MLQKGIKSKAVTLLIGLLFTLLGIVGFGTVAYSQQREQRRPEWIERDIREEQQREQQTQEREQQRPEWIERDIREEQQRERYERGLPTWQQRELEQERQERTNRIPRELQERREQLLRERNIREPQYQQAQPSRIEGSYVLQEGNGHLVLRNGDVIQLPSRQYWEPGAKVTVSRISGPQLHYQVTIVNGRNEQQVEKYVDAAQQAADYVSDVIDAVMDPSPYHKAKVVYNTMRPILTPVPLNEGETQWAYTYSRNGGLTTVQMIYLR